MAGIDELVGQWDGAPYAYGSMESSQLAFLSDGSGWGTWRNAAGGMELTLLAWHRLDSTTITLTEVQLISGSWHLGQPDHIITDEPPLMIEKTTCVRYEIVEEIPPLGRDSTRALKLDHAFMFAKTYAFARQDITVADMPMVINPDAQRTPEG